MPEAEHFIGLKLNGPSQNVQPFPSMELLHKSFFLMIINVIMK